MKSSKTVDEIVKNAILTELSILTKNINFDENINFDHNINIDQNVYFDNIVKMAKPSEYSMSPTSLKMTFGSIFSVPK